MPEETIRRDERRHPPGPCEVEVTPEAVPSCIELKFANGEYVTIAGLTQPVSADLALANRIAVCFNALQHIPSEHVSEIVKLGLEAHLRGRLITELDRRRAHNEVD